MHIQLSESTIFLLCLPDWMACRWVSGHLPEQARGQSLAMIHTPVAMPDLARIQTPGWGFRTPHRELLCWRPRGWWLC